MIDRNHLAQQTGQDIKLQRDVLTLFVAQLQDLCRVLAGDLRAMRDVDDRPDLALLFHRVRGAAEAVGATAVAAALASAEQQVDRHGAWRDGTHRLRTVLDKTVQDVRDLIAALPKGGLAKDDETN